MSAVAVSPIEFDAPSHTYKLDGRDVPSVTKVLEPFSGLEFAIAKYGQEYIDRAADFGRNVHLACELFDRDELDLPTLDEPLVPYVNAWEKFQADTGFIVTLAEQPVYSRQLRYAGTPDRIGVVKLEDWMIDLKSTTGVPRTVGAQTAAYVKAWEEMNPGRKIRKRYSLQLKPDGTYSLKPLTDPGDFSRFQAALTLYRSGWIYSAKRA